MLIECFFDPIMVDWTLKQKVSSFRYWRSEKPANEPNPLNVYNINKNDFAKLLYVIDHVAIVCTEIEADFVSGNLYLQIIDEKKGNIEKDDFLASVFGREKRKLIDITWNKKKHNISYVE